MNDFFEKSLREQIKKIQIDPDLTSEEKQIEIQKILHNRRTINTASAASAALDSTTKQGTSPQPPPDCQYYPNRKCLLECIQCKKFYHCRFCHNDTENHKFDRHHVDFVKCIECDYTQSPTQQCTNKECGVMFGQYYCDICHLYSDHTNVYHCDGCGICRKGPQENFEHCTKCNMCISISVKDHKCFSNTFEGNCAICNYGLFDMIGYGSLLQCGHAIHSSCMQQYIASNYRCPLCKKSMVDMTKTWDLLSVQWKDALQIRDENKMVTKHCNDCCESFSVGFSPFMLYQCTKCNGFNTC